MEEFTVPDAAKMLKMHPRTVARLIRNGEFGHVEKRAQKYKYFVTKDQVEEWLTHGGSYGSVGDYNLFPLKQLVHEKYGTQLEFSRVVGYSPEHVNKMIIGYEGFTFKAIERFCLALDIPTEQIGKYFFTKKEKKNDRG